MADLDLQQRVLKLLSEFRGMEPLKQLFWSLLGYERINTPVATRGWPDTASGLLAEEPVLLAGHDGFDVIYIRLDSSGLPLMAERPVVRRLLSDHPHALFVFSNTARDRWHFLNVKTDPANPDRPLFRRITVGPEEQLRTAAERLSLLELESIRPDPARLAALEIWSRHEEAFDVEKVTKRFFERYAEVFGQVEALITGIPADGKKRLFTQRLFNRLMFIAFIQKKGWLKLGGRKDYLEALWDAYSKDPGQGNGFYAERLEVLFFTGLNTPHDVDIVGINRTSPFRNDVLTSLIGDVPYLNGGLFEQEEHDLDSGVVVPDGAIDLILHGLFGLFNFTVTESTPLDVEVAVDPEMLGKVFEELVTGRHETGSYYTPKPVVAFMGREALKGYLASELPRETRAEIERFVERQDPVGLRDPEAVLEALRRVKVCDPACGSGAYLLGMLHELLELRATLFRSRSLDALSTYDRKLEIIQSNLYGVDLDPFAVNIARLRLWLSLAVDFDGDDPPPLPNLDFKIEVGDSLLGPDPGKTLQTTLRGEVVQQYLDLKRRYMRAGDPGEKRRLKAEIEALRAEIELWTRGGARVEGFDWVVEFAEVFADGGFDVVLANPPYVRADAQYRHIQNEGQRRMAVEQWKKYRARLVKTKMYTTLYEKWDLYVPFLERGHQLLRQTGRMIFIVPDSYNGAKYAQRSHELFVTDSTVVRIDFCTDIPLFNAAVANTIVHFVRVRPTPTSTPMRVRRRGLKPEDFDTRPETLPAKPQIDAGAQVFRLQDVTPSSCGREMTELGRICYISYGLRANADERYWKGEFVTADLVSDVRDTKHPKPFIEGKDLVRWWIKRVQYLEWGTARAPRKFARRTFPELHDAPEKLIALVVAVDGPPVIIDTSGHVTTHTSCILVPWWQLHGVRNRSIRKTATYRDEIRPSDPKPRFYREELEATSRDFAPKYVLAVMNSSYAREWLSGKRRSKNHVYPDDWKPLPIFPASNEQQAVITVLVDEILALYNEHGYPLQDAAAQRLAELEAEIDRKVAGLHRNPGAAAEQR